MKWTEKYKVNSNDVDFNNIMSVSNLLRHIQDCADCAMNADGPTYMELFDRGMAFVLSRIRVSIYKAVHSHDELTVETWATESRGAQFNRCYRVLDAQGEIVAEAVSVWALCGVRDRKLYRTTEVELNYRVDEMLELDQPARFRIPEDALLRLMGEREVEYADVDLNGHMHNTRYPDIITSYLSESMKGKRVIGICIVFKSEALLGERLKFYSGQYDGTWYVRTIRENGSVNVEAEILLEEI